MNTDIATETAVPPESDIRIYGLRRDRFSMKDLHGYQGFSTLEVMLLEVLSAMDESDRNTLLTFAARMAHRSRMK